MAKTLAAQSLTDRKLQLGTPIFFFFFFFKHPQIK